ncbi:aldehyde dehydrogenase family 3 member A2 isoform X1 [Folsomia candida]|uniref:aldehyde dehydrogenase family 3 member A2 isoform X1 n=1 Tax=Folsomia candida TaxID=158441 RepID=UPI001604A5B2|nr:aldehyde dehydrogenase family 3 member A2 isoform X1 [Folsomia candida]
MTTVVTEVYAIEVKIGASPRETKLSKYNENYAETTQGLRDAFKSGRTLSYGYRLDQLKNLQRLVSERSSELVDVLYKDLRKPKMEASGELVGVEVEINEAIRCLQTWMTPEQLPNNLLFPNDKAYIKPDPYGLVLILGAWNYPVALTLQPLVGAISAGNCAIVKPSEIAPFTAAKIAELVPKYLDPKCFRVIEGDVDDTKKLLKQRFDYIFCTSSTRVGKHVMMAAAENLTGVTLELGGKSPVYVHDSADLDLSLKRILWGKLLNMGQTCIAPDYIICSKKVQDYFVTHAKTILEKWYGPSMKESMDICRIINSYHFDRLKKLLVETRGGIVLGGEFDSNDLWISPTFVVNVEDNDVLMEDEIFGPILPFVNAETPLEALNYLNAKTAKPLVIYLFSQNKSVNKQFLELTTSGSLSINEVILHCGWHGLPFGGVQESGMGSYHGKYSFDCFSHRKSCLARDFSFVTEKLSAIRYPPYNRTELKIKFLSTMLRRLHLFKLSFSFTPSHLVIFLLGLLVMFASTTLLAKYQS